MATFPLYNDAMRRALKLPQNDAGVLVTNVIPNGTCDGILKSGDLLFAIDGNPIDSAGQILIEGSKIDLNEIVERKFAGDKVQLRYLSDGTWHDKDVELKTLPQNRMYAIQYEKTPRYIVFAGLVFQPLDTNLFATKSFKDINVRRLYQDYLPKGLFTEREDIVILTRIESDQINSQMTGFTGRAVDTINGTTVRNMKHAHELLHPDDPPEFYVVELFGGSRPLIIPSAEVNAANERIQKIYAIDQLSNLEE